MKKKINYRKAILFLVVLIAIILLVNVAYTKLILPKKTFYNKEMLYRAQIANLSERKLEYIFFGDSHAFHGINPEFIPKTHNYATGAENYIKTFYKLRKIIYKDEVEIKTIVLELDPHTFSTRLTDETNLFNELEVYKDFVSLREINKVRNELLPKLWLEANVPFIGNGKEFGILIREPEFNEVNEFGWLKNKGNFSLVDKNASALTNYKDTFEGQERISNVSLEYLEKTLELAEKNEVNVVFIVYPYTKEYEAALAQHNITKDDGYYDFIFERINATIENYSVLDYSMLYSEKDYLFGDPAHLNYIGAEIFSKKVNEDLENLELEDNFEKVEIKDGQKRGNWVYIGLTLALIEVIVLIWLLFLPRKTRKP